ncbi:hypothetical protein WEI85_15695 [Actinomycetes bacterium KLBMP 9797]
MKGGLARGRGAARGTPSPYRQGFVTGLCVGTTLALVVGVLAFVLAQDGEARPSGTVAAPDPTGQSATGQPRAAIDVTAGHLGDLKVRIEAQVSAPTSYDPLTRAQVVAYTDMVAMPMAHRQGPIVMAEDSARPGVYQAVTTLPMVGEYDVMVEVRQPMAATAHKRLQVDAVKPPS